MLRILSCLLLGLMVIVTAASSVLPSHKNFSIPVTRRSLGNPHSKISVACQSTGCQCLDSPAGSFWLLAKVLQTPWRHIIYFSICIFLALVLAGAWLWLRVVIVSICHAGNIGRIRPPFNSGSSMLPPKTALAVGSRTQMVVPANFHAQSRK